MIQDEIKNFFVDKKKDYTYIVLFLIFLSVFIFFAISPSIRTIVSLKKEKSDLEKIDSIYQEKIFDIYQIQKNFEENREKLYLIDEAVSRTPKIDKIIYEIKKVANRNNFLIEKAVINDIDFLKNNKGIEKIDIIIEGKTQYNNLVKFINDLFNQRRLKTINKLKINKEKDSSQSSDLIIYLLIQGYYL